VQVIQDGQVIANPALANLPMFEGTQVVTGNEGRAEVQLDDGGSIARLSPNTTLTFTVLQQQGSRVRTEVVVNGGLAYFEMKPSNSERSLKVNYGTTAFSATSFSVVRVNLDSAPGGLAVFSGNVHVEGAGGQQADIHGGESLVLNGGGGYDISETIEQDSWDSWNADRDQALNAEFSERTQASTGVNDYQSAGMSDLDANGNWYDVPGQGYVWSPYDAQAYGASWDPYGFGNWVFYPRFGYVWVSGYNWGYAPYQCGYWNFYSGFGWGWAPGFGCSPWWGGGGYYGGGYYNIATFPRGYRPPRRPLPGPHPVPHNPGDGGVRAGFHNSNGTIRRTGYDPVPVDRRLAGTTSPPGTGRPLPQPVTIAGHTVEPLRPVAPRAGYERSTTTFVNRNGNVPSPSQGYYGGSHPAYPGNTYPGSTMPGRTVTGNPSPVYRPPAPVSRPAPPPARAPSYGGAPSAGSHSSMGGGGGGAPHSAPAPSAPHK